MQVFSLQFSVATKNLKRKAKNHNSKLKTIYSYIVLCTALRKLEFKKRKTIL